MHPRLKTGLSFILVLALGFMSACAGQQTSAPLQTPDVELSLDPPALTVAPGTTGTLTLTVLPLNGLTGTVSLSADAGATGITVSLATSSLSLGTGPATAVVSVHVPETASAGDRNLRLLVLGGFGTRDLPFRITVPAATLLPVHTHINSTNANLPLMLFKDGDAPWRPLEGVDGSYQAAVTDQAGRYGLAYGYICGIDTFHSYQMNHIFMTLRESGSLDVTFICDPPPGPAPALYSLQGQLGGQGSRSGFLVTNAGTFYFDGSTRSYLTQVLKGKGDLTGWTFDNAATRLPIQFFLERGRDAQSDATRDVDFATEGFAPGSLQPITYGPVGSDEAVQGAVRYFTAGGQFFDLGGGTLPTAYGSFPASHGQPGDSYSYGFGALATDHSEVVYGGSTGLPGALSVQFPTAVGPFEVTWPRGAYLRPAMRWASVAPEPKIQEFSFSQTNGQEEVYWFVYFTAGWLGAGNHTLEMSDLSGFPGWNPAWGFRPGIPVSIQLGQFGTMPGSAGSKNLLDGPDAPGSHSDKLDRDGEQNRFFSLYPWPLRSNAFPLGLSQGLGEVEGRFRILGLASPQSSQTGDSFSATRLMSSTP